jgi:NAD-dependent dihydropyrimidine dehydrogenase PreA subunit
LKSRRKIISIDEQKCNGCGLCIPNCPEGAIQMIDGKARLISDIFCDGLGACLGHCPEGAITIEERETEAYDESLVMENIIRQGPNVIRAHIEHLKDHGETEFLKQAMSVLAKHGIEYKENQTMNHQHAVPGGCPGSRTIDMSGDPTGEENISGNRPSQLRQWPVQLHLVSPNAPYFRGKDVLLAADCTAFALGDFHKDWLKGRSLAIACPKLDDQQEIYLQKLQSMIEEAKINTLTVLIMEVPCCGGLVHLAKKAAESSSRKIPIKQVVVSLQGAILSEDWI